jgi:hypothetical protein
MKKRDKFLASEQIENASFLKKEKRKTRKHAPKGPARLPSLADLNRQARLEKRRAAKREATP